MRPIWILPALALLGLAAAGGEGVRIEGRVLGADGTPVAGARVTLVTSRSPRGLWSNITGPTVETDASGAYTCLVPDGSTHLVLGACAEGLVRTASTPVEVGVAMRDGMPDLVLGEGLTLSGRVVDLATGHGITAARVRLGPAPAGSTLTRVRRAWLVPEPIVVTAREGGRILWPGLPDALLAVVGAEADGFVPHVDPVRNPAYHAERAVRPGRKDLVVTLRVAPLPTKRWPTPPRVTMRLGAPALVPAGGFQAVAWSGDGNTVVTAGGPNVQTRDPESGLQTGGTLGGAQIRSVAVEETGRRVLMGGLDGLVRLWHTEDQTFSDLLVTGKRRPVFAVALAANGRLALAGGEGSGLHVWRPGPIGDETSPPIGDLSPGEERDVGPGPVTSISATRDGTVIASTGYERVDVWRSGAESMTLGGIVGLPLSVAVRPDGRRVAAGAWQTVVVWDLATGEVVNRLEEKGAHARALEWSPDGASLAVGRNDGHLALWDLADEAKLRWRIRADLRRVRDLAVSPRGDEVATVGQANGLRFWRSEDGSERETESGHVGAVLAVARIGSRARVATVEANGTVFVWDTSTGKATNRFRVPDGPFRIAAFSGDGRRLALGDAEGRVSVLDVVEGVVSNVLVEDGRLQDLAFSADGEQLAVLRSAGRYGGRVRVHELRSGETRMELVIPKGGPRTVALSPDGDRVAVAGDGGRIRVHRVDSREVVFEAALAATTDLAWSLDGRRIASVGADGSARVFSLSSGKSVTLPPRERDAPLVGIAFSRDGSHVAAVGRVVHVWSVAFGRLVARVGYDTTAHPTCVAFAPAGGHVVTGDLGGVANVWDYRVRR